MGLEAASNVVRWCGVGALAAALPLEPEEAHVLAARRVLRAAQRAAELNPLARLLPAGLA
jgi:hypothetical protein